MNDAFAFKYNQTKYVINPLFDEDHIFQRIKRASTFYEIGLLEAIRKCNVEGTYLDIGANIGNHSVFFMNECKCSKLISIEPEPSIYAVLIKNIVVNNKKKIIAKTYNCALGDKECKVSMFMNPKNCGNTQVTNENGDINCHILDDLIDDSNVKLIKIDTEGYELKILNGAKKIILGQHPILVCEADTPDKFNNINSFLSQFGYKTDKKKMAPTPTFLWK